MKTPGALQPLPIQQQFFLHIILWLHECLYVCSLYVVGVC
jgi:hypothetical protein